MIAYLDTHVAVWLAEGRVKQIGARARRLLEKADLLVSPIVLLELEYLHEVQRSKLRALDILRKLEHEIEVRVCDLGFAEVTRAALDETWTRDPFDRMVVAQAKANGFALLITADEQIAAHYLRTIW